MCNNQSHPSRKEREEEFRRNLVLDAAETLFAEKGFHGTTVSDIADRSELAKASLYQLFQSKEDIISAIVGRKLDQVWTWLREIFSSPMTPAEKIRQAIRTKLRVFWESRDFARIFLHELRGLHWCMESPLINVYRKQVEELMEAMQTVFEEGQRVGEFRADMPASMLLAGMEGFSNAVIYNWLMNREEQLDLDIALGRAEELFLHGASPRKGSDQNE